MYPQLPLHAINRYINIDAKKRYIDSLFPVLKWNKKKKLYGKDMT